MPGGEEWQNVLHFAGAASSDTNVDDALEQLTTFYETIATQLSNAWGVDEFRVGEAAGPVLRIDTVDGLVGGGSSMVMPNDCAVLVRWRTVHPGRNGRGRSYISGALAGSVDRATSASAGIVSVSLRSAIASACGALMGDLDVPLQVYSRVTGTGYSVTGGEVSGQWATQRRRDLETVVAPSTFPG